MGKKEVRNELKKYSFGSIFYEGAKDDCRYSLSQVILNGINYADKVSQNNYILLWTTCDVIYEPQFFETIIKNYKENIIGTSHPHVVATSIDNYKNGKFGKLIVSAGFDLVYFDDKFLGNPKVSDSLRSYIFKDWGYFEHFLIALVGLVQSSGRINVYEEAKIFKIKNNRQLTDDSKEFLEESSKLNKRILEKFLWENDLKKRCLKLAYCHTIFKSTKKPLKHFIWVTFVLFKKLFKIILEEAKNEKTHSNNFNILSYGSC